MKGTRPHTIAVPLILFDGDCGFCRRLTLWLSNHLRQPDCLRLMAYQDAEITDELKARCALALMGVLPDGSLLRAGRAVLFCLEFTRWRRLARTLAQPPFIYFVEVGYAWVAQHRTLVSRWSAPFLRSTRAHPG